MSNLFTGSRKFDRYSYERLNGTRSTVDGELRVDTASVRTRTIFSGDLVLSTHLRATTLPTFNGATGNPLDLAPKGGLSDRMHEFVIPGMSSDLKRSEIELTIRMAGLQAQSIIGPQVLSSLMEVQIFEGVSLFIAGDSIYYLVENDLTEELIMKRTDVVREMCQGSKLEDKLNALDATITKEFAGRQSSLPMPC